MKSIDIEDLQTQIDEAISRVRDGEIILLTSRDEVIARIIPTGGRLKLAEIAADLARLDALRDEIGTYVTEPADAAQLISDMRR